MKTQDDTKSGPSLTGGQVHEGEIARRTRARRIIYIAGIIGLVVLGFVIQFTTHT